MLIIHTHTICNAYPPLHLVIFAFRSAHIYIYIYIYIMGLAEKWPERGFYRSKVRIMDRVIRSKTKLTSLFNFM